MTDHPLTPRDRCQEHLRVTIHLSPLLGRLVLYRAMEMLDLRQLNELVAQCNEIEQAIEDGLHGIHHQAVLRQSRD